MKYGLQLSIEGLEYGHAKHFEEEFERIHNLEPLSVESEKIAINGVKKATEE